MANVKLEYSTDGGSTYPNVIIATTPNTGSYAWTVPDSITTAARVKVSDAGNANALDTSNANFKIRGSLTVTAPNGAEAWPINTTQSITWTKVGSIANVKLEYSTNGFTDELQTYSDRGVGHRHHRYAVFLADSGRAERDGEGANLDVSDATVFDPSNANFSIKGFFDHNGPQRNGDLDRGGDQ